MNGVDPREPIGLLGPKRQPVLFGLAVQLLAGVGLLGELRRRRIRRRAFGVGGGHWLPPGVEARQPTVSLTLRGEKPLLNPGSNTLPYRIITGVPGPHGRRARRLVPSFAAAATSYAAAAMLGPPAWAAPADTVDQPTPCWSEQIAVSASPTQGAVGHRGLTLIFTLAGGAEPCTLTGYPGVDSGDRRAAHSCPAHAARVHGRPARRRRCAADRHPVAVDAGAGHRGGHGRSTPTATRAPPTPTWRSALPTSCRCSPCRPPSTPANCRCTPSPRADAAVTNRLGAARHHRRRCAGVGRAVTREPTFSTAAAALHRRRPRRAAPSHSPKFRQALGSLACVGCGSRWPGAWPPRNAGGRVGGRLRRRRAEPRSRAGQRRGTALPADPDQHQRQQRRADHRSAVRRPGVL